MGVGSCERCGKMGLTNMRIIRGLKMDLCNECKQVIIKATLLPIEMEVTAYEKAIKDLEAEEPKKE